MVENGGSYRVPLGALQLTCHIGLIYRDYRPVHYSPSSRSALAEAELTYQDDHVSHSVYVTFGINTESERMSNVLRKLLAHEQSAHLLVWTTTPWTLTANMVQPRPTCPLLVPLF